jgi:hypothetical protein
MHIYPSSSDEAFGQPLNFRPKTLRSVQAFARSRPWVGTFDERCGKFRILHSDLCAIYGMNTDLVFKTEGTGDSGASSYSPSTDTISLRGRLSVITFLHEWGHALKGESEHEACRWSLQLFARCFPRSWERLRFEGHVARRRERDD